MPNLITPLSQEFNKFFNEALNCRIKAPPYYVWRVPQTFTFAKRYWLTAVTGCVNASLLDEIFDVYYSWSNIYQYWRKGNDLKVYKNEATLIWSKTSWYNTTDNIEYKFITIRSATGTGWSEDTEYTLTGWSDWQADVSTATWTPNAFAWKFAILYWAGTSIDSNGQYIAITSNTATSILGPTLVNPSAGTKMRIFDSLWAVPAWLSDTGLQVMHNDDIVIPIASLPKMKDAVSVREKIFFVTDMNIVMRSTGWIWVLTVVDIGESVLWTVTDFVNIVDYQNYILLVWLWEINNIQETITTTTDSLWVTTSTTTYPIFNITYSVGVFKQWALSVSNNWLYMISNKKQFVAISITPAGTNKYTVESKNQWIYIQKYIDNITTNDKLRISINDDEIYLIINTWSGANIHIYDMFYQGWHKWTTEISIHWFKRTWFADRLFMPWSTFLDNAEHKYVQALEQVIWEDTLMQNKRHYFIKLHLAKDTTPNTTVEFDVNVWSDRYSFSKSLATSGYLNGLFPSPVSAIWTSLLWMGLIGDSWSDLLALMADVCSIEIPTWFFYEIGIIRLKANEDNRFECGGFLHEYNVFVPAVTAYTNTI